MRLMLDLALNNTGAPISLKDVARRQEISDKYLEQIISVLNRAGYVRSVRGAQGGYLLRKAPEEYTVGMILRLTEGSLAPVACLDEGDDVDCEKREECVTLILWKRSMMPSAVLWIISHCRIWLTGREKKWGLCDMRYLEEISHAMCSLLKRKESRKSMSKLIYLDNAATTQVYPEVLDAMLPYFTEHYGNPAAIYSFAGESERAVAKARKQIADVIGAKTEEIYFTGGGSESDNWALKATAEAYSSKGKHIITSAIEHHAILHTAQWLELHGFEVTYVGVDEMVRLSWTSLRQPSVRIQFSSLSWQQTTRSEPSSH